VSLARIFWDTNLFIYLFEENPHFVDRVQEIRRTMIVRQDQLCTSSLTVGEVLVKPISAHRLDLTNRYRAFFRSPGLTVVPFDSAAAFTYALVRQDKTIRPPDAIQLACAGTLEVDLFITNDDRLSKKHIRGIQFITSLDRAPM
jgi:predicted nucleic acid-binding protein